MFCSQRRGFSTFNQNFDLKKGTIKKMSYERRAYEKEDVRTYFGLYLIGLRKPVLRDSKGYNL